MSFPGFPIVQYDYIRHIHQKLFTDFQYKTDLDQYRQVEYWVDDAVLKRVIDGNAKLVGDCEEFARCALGMLRKRGINARLVYCKTELGEGHCVCEAMSDDGLHAYFLDNRYRTPMVREQLKGYSFISVSPTNPVPGDKRPWLKVKL